MNTIHGIRSTSRNITPVAGTWDYDGSCSPSEGGYSHQQTFSVGCFQWVPMARGKRVKRAKSVKRIIGRTSNPKDVYEKAEAFCVAQEKQSQPCAD